MIKRTATAPPREKTHAYERLGGDLLTLVVGVAGAIALYAFGLGYPIALRVRGDAAAYMSIAARFDSLGTALAYVGDRSLGMPLVDYVFAPANPRAPGAVESWADSVCAFLLLMHLSAAAAVVWIVRRGRWLDSRLADRLLFVFLATFPAMIGHTTTPLTDALAVDLSLLALAIMLCAIDAPLRRGLPLGAGAGLLSTFAVLSRPSYSIPTLASAVALVAIVSSRQRRMVHPASVACLVIVSLLAVVAYRCAGVYGTLCLQNPKTFQPLLTAQMGLRGGRVLWNGPYSANGEFPVLPDSVLASRFYAECKLERLIGTDDASLTGCLLRRPHLLPVYVAKKWIGLFDHFRFQPYVERMTPGWLRTLSRTYDAVVLAGFFFAWYTAIGAARRWRQTTALADPTLAAYSLFLLLMLVEHTFLHPEDRYSLVLVPACALFAGRLAERVAADVRAGRRRNAAWLMGGALVSVVLFVWQLVVWDQTAF